MTKRWGIEVRGSLATRAALRLKRKLHQLLYLNAATLQLQLRAISASLSTSRSSLSAGKKHFRLVREILKKATSYPPTTTAKKKKRKRWNAFGAVTFESVENDNSKKKKDTLLA